MIHFTAWKQVPAHFKTKTQLDQMGMKPAPDQQPVARVHYKLYRKQKTADLYDMHQAQQKRPPTPAQLVALEKGRKTALENRTCQGCGQTVVSGGLKDGYCRECRLLVQGHKWAKEWAGELVGQTDWVVLDTETTGLDNRAEIVQIGIVGHDGRELYGRLVRPSSPIPPHVTHIHGITDEMVADAATWAEVYPDVAGLLTDKIVVVYNAEFDSRLVRQSCEIYSLPMPEVRGWTCAMKAYARRNGEWSNYWGDFKWVKLGEACYRMDIEVEGAHDATADALMTWKLVQKMAEQ